MAETRQKRVLHVVDSMNRGGQETLIMNIYRCIDRSCLQFDFLVSDTAPGDYDAEIRELGGRILFQPQSGKSIPHVTPLLNAGKLYGFLKSVRKDYIAVHFHNHHAYSSLLQVVPARLAHMGNVILHSHNNSGPHPFVHRLVRPLLNSFRFIRFSCSDKASEWMYSGREARMVRNGVLTENFRFNEPARSALRKELGLDGRKVILHVGRFTRQKNHGMLIDIFNAVHRLDSTAHLVLVGRGETEDSTIEKIRSLNLESAVSVLGVREDIAELMSACDLFLLPSLHEGLPVVLVEAQANGIPVLCSDVITSESVLAENLLMLPLSASPEEWAACALELLRSGHAAENCGEVAARGFDIKQVAMELQDFYEGLC